MSGVSKNEFLHGDIRKGLLKLALPLMLLSLVNTLYNIVDTFWIGKMGELQVGAVSLIGPIMSCGNAFIFGLSAAGIAMISKAIGSGNREKANRYATHLFFISIVFGVIIYHGLCKYFIFFKAFGRTEMFIHKSSNLIHV